MNNKLINISKKCLCVLLMCASLVSCKIGGSDTSNNNNNNNTNNSTNTNNPVNNTLSTIDNLTFDNETCLFNWENVNNATSYVIEINGVEYTTENNYYKFIPFNEETNARVKAIDSTDNYTSSSWSNALTHNATTEQLLSYINNFVNNMLPEGYDLVKIVSMNIKDNVLYTDAVFTKGTTNYLYQMEHTYEHNLVSLEDVLNFKMPETNLLNHRETVEYDSASYLVESNEFCGELENYRQQGYNISVVSSYTITKSGYEDGRQFWIYATYKLDSGYDVKYAKSTILCAIKNPSTNEKLNYTIRLKDSQARSLDERSFELISPEATKFCELMDKYNNQ